VSVCKPLSTLAMQIDSISLKNYRCFADLELTLGGDSMVLVGPNSSGKSSLLEAVRAALQGAEIALTDFRDATEPLELSATLSGISPEQQALFPDAVDFSQTPPVLRLGLQSIWDAEEREVSTTHGFPDSGWRRVSRSAREAIPLIHLPAWRDPARLLSVIGRRSVLAGLIADLDLDVELEQTVAAIRTAAEALAEAEPLQELLTEGSEQLARLMPGLPDDPFSLGPGDGDPREVLRNLRLALSLEHGSVALGADSGGFGQASIFAFLLAAIASASNSIVLVDEPEAALHPHPQRALLGALRASSAQSILTTHSAAALDRRDPREITRIRRDAGQGAILHRAETLEATDARALIRYSTSLTAEAYFADTVILVEGFSDFLATRVLAATLGVELDAAGVSLISLDGADVFVHYLRLFGPGGLDLDLRGLCDADHEEEWQSRLTQAGIPITDRQTMNAAGFYICDPDLEAELLGALDTDRVAAVIAADGGQALFDSYANQPAQQGRSTEELQLGFVQKPKAKIRWAPLIAAEMNSEEVPAPLRSLLEDL
jgi:putative ATP-dependent endonuclease of the OLD family